MASQFANLVLFGWPLVVFYFFKRFDLRMALCLSIVMGYLFVPRIVGFDLPLVPPYDKQLVVNVSAAAICVFMSMMALQRRDPALSRARPSTAKKPEEPVAENRFVVRRGRILFWSLMALLFGATIITAMNNSEPLIRGTRFLSGLRPYDVLSIDLALLITITPYLLARRYLATPESHAILLRVLVLGGLFYSVLTLWEIRMSPQLNKQIYGFSPHDFRQSVRGDSYRPIVFMNHGLWLAILMCMSSIAAMALWREKLKSPDAAKWFLASIYLLVVLYLCSSLGALLILVLLLPLVFLFGPGVQMFLAAIVSIIILLYPMLRGSGVVPTQAIYNATAQIDAKRAESLLFRFENEDELLAHANKKPLAGWGTWGRNRVFNEKGGDVAATDGFWVIIVGVYGWLGYIAQFGLLATASILLALNRRRFQVTPATAGVALVVAASLVDLIPNATSSPILWMMAGALMGRYQTAEARVKEVNIRKAAAARNGQRNGLTDPPVEPDEVPQTRPARDRTERPLHQRRPREG